MSFLSKVLKRFTYRVALAGGWRTATMSGNETFTKLSAQVQVLDPGGADRTITLPAVSVSDDGYGFLVINTADAAEKITVYAANGSTVVGIVPRGGRLQAFVSSTGAWTSGGTAGGYFLSGEVTGDGSSQDTAHGLGTTPGLCVAIASELTGGAFGVAAGTHDATNAKFTVTTGEKYRVLALK